MSSDSSFNNTDFFIYWFSYFKDNNKCKMTPFFSYWIITPHTAQKHVDFFQENNVALTLP